MGEDRGITSVAALVLRARGGDELAFRRLAGRHRALLRATAAKYYVPGADRSDLDQEALLGLYKAIRDYRTDRESSFRNFAELCITRQIITAVKTATRNKHTPLNTAQSMSAPSIDGETLDDIVPDPCPDSDPVSHLETKERLRLVTQTVWHSLTAVERQAVIGRANGLTYEEMAGEQGRGRAFKAIDNAYQRGTRKLQEALGQQAA